MIIFPAIDIKEGKVVRLLQGKFDQETVYSSDPISVAKDFEAQGARWLHVVDLDGALHGSLKNTDVILSIARSVKIPVQVGGGIRRKEDIDRLIKGGVARVVLGTVAIEDNKFLKEILKTWKKKIAVSLDCENGLVMKKGWTEKTKIKAVDVVKNFEEVGLQFIIYTDITRDGMLSGPNIEQITKLTQATSIPIIASGGISSMEDLKAISALEDKGVIGVITGKALYEGKINLKEALSLC